MYTDEEHLDDFLDSVFNEVEPYAQDDRPAIEHIDDWVTREGADTAAAVSRALTKLLQLRDQELSGVLRRARVADLVADPARDARTWAVDVLRRLEASRRAAAVAASPAALPG